MATTTIRVSTEIRDLLNHLARTTGTSMQQVLETALLEYRRRQFLEALNTAYATAHTNPQIQADVSAEDAAWDATLLDGLDSMQQWGES